MSVDPAPGVLTDPQSWNRYAYVLNNPYKYVDPDGENPILAAAVIAGISLLVFPDTANAPSTLFDNLIPSQSGLEFSGKITLSEVGGYFAGKVISKAIGIAKGYIPSKGVGLLSKASGRTGINISERGLAHVLDRHTVGGTKIADKSLFYKGEDIVSLIRKAEKAKPIRQPGGNFERIVDAGRPIGVDKATGQPTSTFTVITNTEDDLITAFPGLPLKRN